MTSVPPSPTIVAPPTYESGLTRVLAYVAYGLLMAAIPTAGLAAFVAVVLAYDRRDACGPLLRSHFAFQTRIFWIGFALTFGAGACFLSGLFALMGGPHLQPLESSPAPRLFQTAVSLLVPADVQVWRYHFDVGRESLPAGAALRFGLGTVLLAVAALWSVIAPIFGLTRLASGRPIGHRA